MKSPLSENADRRAVEKPSRRRGRLRRRRPRDRDRSLAAAARDRAPAARRCNRRSPAPPLRRWRTARRVRHDRCRFAARRRASTACTTRASHGAAASVWCALVHRSTQSAGFACAGSVSAAAAIPPCRPAVQRQPIDRPAHAGDDVMPAGRGETAGGNAADTAEPDHGHGQTLFCRHRHAAMVRQIGRMSNGCERQIKFLTAVRYPPDRSRRAVRVVADVAAARRIGQPLPCLPTAPEPK